MPNRKDDSTIEPALINERLAADFLSLSPRAFRAKVKSGEIRQVKIPGLRRVAYDVAELRAIVERWKRESHLKC
jgi:hypothetical protein